MPFSGLLSVVIPVYRSETYLERTVGELSGFLAAHGTFEIILVNDGSPDGVQQVIDRLAAADPRIRFVELGANHGQHAATLKGFGAARGDTVLTLDDDGQNSPASGLAVVEAMERGRLDVVYGKFRATEQGPARRAASRINRWISKVTLGNREGIAITNVRALRGDLARRIAAAASGFPYIDSMIFRATRRIGQVEVEHRSRGDGASTYRLGALVRLWLSHLTTLSIWPLKIATFGCFAVAALGMLSGLVLMISALRAGAAPAGWLSLYVALTVLFSLLFVFLGVVGAYVGRLYVTQNARGLDWVRSQGGGGEGGSSPGSRPA